MFNFFRLILFVLLVGAIIWAGLNMMDGIESNDIMNDSKFTLKESELTFLSGLDGLGVGYKHNLSYILTPSPDYGIRAYFQFVSFTFVKPSKKFKHYRDCIKKNVNSYSGIVEGRIIDYKITPVNPDGNNAAFIPGDFVICDYKDIGLGKRRQVCKFNVDFYDPGEYYIWIRNPCIDNSPAVEMIHKPIEWNNYFIYGLENNFPKSPIRFNLGIEDFQKDQINNVKPQQDLPPCTLENKDGSTPGRYIPTLSGPQWSPLTCRFNDLTHLEVAKCVKNRKYNNIVVVGDSESRSIFTAMEIWNKYEVTDGTVIQTSRNTSRRNPTENLFTYITFRRLGDEGLDIGQFKKEEEKEYVLDWHPEMLQRIKDQNPAVLVINHSHWSMLNPYDQSLSSQTKHLRSLFKVLKKEFPKTQIIWHDCNSIHSTFNLRIHHAIQLRDFNKVGENIAKSQGFHIYSLLEDFTNPRFDATQDGVHFQWKRCPKHHMWVNKGNEDVPCPNKGKSFSFNDVKEGKCRCEIDTKFTLGCCIEDNYPISRDVAYLYFMYLMNLLCN